MQKFIFYLNSKNLKLLSNSGKYHNAGPQGEASYTETDKLNVYTADKPRRCVDYIFTALDVFWKPYLYILLHLQKRLPLPFTYDNEKKMYTFSSLSFLVLYKLCIIKIYLCTKDFFCFYFFPLMVWWWVCGMNGGWRAQSALVPSKPLEVERKCQRWEGRCTAECWVLHQCVLLGCLLGLDTGTQEMGRGRAGGGVHWLVWEEYKKGDGSSQRASCICFQGCCDPEQWCAVLGPCHCQSPLHCSNPEFA